jgi:hypothetical protein
MESGTEMNFGDHKVVMFSHNKEWALKNMQALIVSSS